MATNKIDDSIPKFIMKDTDIQTNHRSENGFNPSEQNNGINSNIYESESNEEEILRKLKNCKIVTNSVTNDLISESNDLDSQLEQNLMQNDKNLTNDNDLINDITKINNANDNDLLLRKTILNKTLEKTSTNGNNNEKNFVRKKLKENLLKKFNTKRDYNSLPLFYYEGELTEIGSTQPGMDCMPLRQQPGILYHNHLPAHHQNYHHVVDQTKSLQELQNEVGALLEFRDLVIETFPDLKNKMASMSAKNSLTSAGLVSNSSLASRREWEPGIRIKRKIIQQKDIPASATNNASHSNNGSTNIAAAVNNVDITSSLVRSRSNSHSGKKEPKSGEGNGSVVQDSGFSTETSSSKEAHSASSTTGAIQGAVATNRFSPNENNDELLNLLDVIHRKSTRLREEVDHLQHLEKDNKIIRDNDSKTINQQQQNNGELPSGCINHKTFQDHINRLNKEDIQLLRKERDRLLDKLAEMEAETLIGRRKAIKMQDEYDILFNIKRDLEEQLKLALSQKLELNSRLHELNNKQLSTNNSSKSSSSQSESSSFRQCSSAATTMVLVNSNSSGNNSATQKPTTFQPLVIDNSYHDELNNSKIKSLYSFHHSDIKNNKIIDIKNLGHLDGIISAPINRLNKLRTFDSRKVAAILLETNVVELRRHLLTLTAQNQIMSQKLEQATKSKSTLTKLLEKSKDDIDDLKFQLDEKDIELEGTKAQLRVLESRSSSKLDYHNPSAICITPQETNRSTSTLIVSCDSPLTSAQHQMIMNSTQISTPSMKAMIPLQMDEIHHQHHSSSTESAQDNGEQGQILNTSTSSNDLYQTPKRRPPSKIPLPGSKSYLAPKPPTGRNNYQQQKSPNINNKTLSRSTGNLYGKSPTSLNRPDSALSSRKDSMGTTASSRSSSSSIPISTTTTTTTKSTPSPKQQNFINHYSNSPPKPKRESRAARNLDSLPRYQAMVQSTPGTTDNSVKKLSSSKKDLSSSFNNGRTVNKNQQQQRRVSSASIIGRTPINDLQQTHQQLTQQQQNQQNDTDNGKISITSQNLSYDSLDCIFSKANDTTKITNFDSNNYLPSSPSLSENTMFEKTEPKPDLIYEFITKSNPPPAFFKTIENTYPTENKRYNQLSEHNCRKFCNDTNCQLIFEIEMEANENEDFTSYENQYILNQKELNGCLTKNSKSIKRSETYDLIFPRTENKKLLKGNKIGNISATNKNNIYSMGLAAMDKNSSDSLKCKLMGSINPNIEQAWFESNGKSKDEKLLNQNPSKILSRSFSNNSDESEKILFYQPVYESKSNFFVNKVNYLTESEENHSLDSNVKIDKSKESFFDSIENLMDDDNHNEINESYDSKEHSSKIYDNFNLHSGSERREFNYMTDNASLASLVSRPVFNFD